MALPGIISCLHPVTTPAELARQLQQGQQTRAEAFWLPAALHDQAAAVLAALDDKSSLFLEQPATGLPLRSHDGVMQEDGTLLLGNGQHLALAKEPGDGGLVPVNGLAEMANWLEAGHLHFAVQLQYSLWRGPSSTSGRSTPTWPVIFVQFYTLTVRSNRGRLPGRVPGEGISRHGAI